jgi:signal transduction histidine kinase
MSTRLLALVIVCVVLPTAILALLAGGYVRNWEAIAAQRREWEAVRVVRQARAAADDELRTTLARIRERMAVSLAAGRSAAQMNDAVSRLGTTLPCAERIFVFMNPWGFILPSEDAASIRAEPDQAALAAALRQDLATRASDAAWVPLAVSGRPYVFTVLGEGGGIYAGFRVNTKVVVEVVRRASLGAESRLLLAVDAAAPGIANHPSDVVVSDSMGGEATVVRAATAPETGTGPVLAEGRLAAPLQDVVVKVYSRVSAADAAARLRIRLFGWGVVLMAVAILAGIVVAGRTLVAELRRTRNEADMVLGVSHDLRSPAASIRALAESLYMGRVTDTAKQQRFVATILRDAERLGHLVERTLYLVRFERGAVPFSRSPCPAVEWARAVVEAFVERRGGMEHTHPAEGRTEASADTAPANRREWRWKAGGADVVVGFEAEGESLPPVRIDRVAMSHALTNLLDNAWNYTVVPRMSAAKASSEVAMEARIGVRIRRGHAEDRSRGTDGVCLAVRDNGIGMTPREQRKVFHRFFRTSAARQVHATGIGLGLAFCRYVLESHGGRIWVHSTSGEGTEFTMWVPFAEG